MVSKRDVEKEFVCIAIESAVDSINLYGVKTAISVNDGEIRISNNKLDDMVDEMAEENAETLGDMAREYIVLYIVSFASQRMETIDKEADR